MSCMFVPNFEAIGYVTLVLESENRPASLAQIAVSVKNGLSTAKNISYGCMSQDTLSSQPNKYFDIVWGCHPPGTPLNGPPKNQFFERLNLECRCFMISADI